jgi:hypothetical protein
MQKNARFSVCLLACFVFTTAAVFSYMARNDVYNFQSILKRWFRKFAYGEHNDVGASSQAGPQSLSLYNNNKDAEINKWYTDQQDNVQWRVIERKTVQMKMFTKIVNDPESNAAALENLEVGDDFSMTLPVQDPDNEAAHDDLKILFKVMIPILATSAVLLLYKLFEFSCPDQVHLIQTFFLEHLSRIQEEASLIFKKCFQGGKD